jgi:hypothetical protein
MVSVPKQGSNPGMPRGKKNIIIIFDFDKATMNRDEKGVKVSSLTMVGNAKPIGLFVNQSSIDAGDEVQGDAYSRGFIHHVNFDHPGTDLEIAEFKANNVNGNLGAIVIGCDASETTAKVYGTPCAPLTMQAGNEQDTNEAHNNHFELKTEVRTWPVGIIDKSAIPATDSPEINTFLGIGNGI